MDRIWNMKHYILKDYLLGKQWWQERKDTEAVSDIRRWLLCVAEHKQKARELSADIPCQWAFHASASVLFREHTSLLCA